MIIKKQIKDLKGRTNSKEILAQYVVPYNIHSFSRYKHIDELLVDNGDNTQTTIKATLGPIDLGIIPFGQLPIYVVPSYEENRIDLIANKLYGSSSLYWVLCYINNIADPLKIEAGRILFVPELSSVKRFPNPLA